MIPTCPTILITIDVEDWFQVENFKSCIPFSSWPSNELRVERNVHRLLELLDEVRAQPQMEQFPIPAPLGSPNTPAYPVNDGQKYTGSFSLSKEKALHHSGSQPQQTSREEYPPKEHHKKLRATFFVLGWVAERLPGLVREIHKRDHEIASHGYNHRLCNDCSPQELRQDLADSKKRLEDISGERVYGYRAPSFSINSDVLKMIQDSGYLYDSSYNSFGLHSRYGKVDFSQNGKRGLAYQLSEGFFELPISNIEFKIQNSKFKITHLTLPWGGGGYFRLIPLFFFLRGINSILKKYGAYLFYLHPWEIDVEQPRVEYAGKAKVFRHYVNLKKTYKRLCGIFEFFKKCEYISCEQYLQATQFSESVDCWVP